MTPDTARMKNIALNFIVPIICILVSVLLFAFIVYPAFTKIPELEQKLSDTTALRDQLREKDAKLGRFIDFKAVIEENSKFVDRVMPADQNVPGLLDQLSQIAKESGLDVTKLSYSLSDTDPNETRPTYSAVLVSLGVDGTYSQMIEFMKAAENASRVVTVSNFRFNTVNISGQQLLSFTFIISAPFMKVQSAAVTDEPINLDVTSGDFTAFLNRVKGLRYFEQSGDNKIVATKVADVTADAKESTQSSGTR
jgi:type IV pilus assembly protein PilO